jgi:hypothetical protein
MEKHNVRHDNLRKVLAEIHDDLDNIQDSSIVRLNNEIRHSDFILAADFNGGLENMPVFEHNQGKYGFIFTDMDEFHKVFSDEEISSNSFPFEFYKSIVDTGDIAGFLLNPESESLLMVKEIFDGFDKLPNDDFPLEEAYNTSELKDLWDSLNNDSLEEFIEDPSNIGRYEELIGEISNSTLFILAVSSENLDSHFTDGIVSMEETGPLARVYLDHIGGKYATVYTSEGKTASVRTDDNKYAQIVNFSQISHYALVDDLDGIIINPDADNVMLSREVLLEYWELVEDTCNDYRLNKGIMHMIQIEV